MLRARSLLVVVLGAAATGGLVAAARIPGGGPSWADVEQVAAELDACLRESAAGVASRAQTLAELPRLAVAVATDAETVRDLTDEELAFRPRPNETIELAQVSRAGGAPASLIRFPADSAVAVPLGSPGVQLIVTGASLRVAAVVRLEPRERADEVYGIVAVSWLSDLERVVPLLGALGGGVKLETSAGPIEIGGAMPAQRETIAVPLASPAGQVVRLVAPAPAEGGWRVGTLAVAMGVAAGSLFFAIALMWRRATVPELVLPEQIGPSQPTQIQFGAPGMSPFVMPDTFGPLGPPAGTSHGGRTLR